MIIKESKQYLSLVVFILAVIKRTIPSDIEGFNYM